MMAIIPHENDVLYGRGAPINNHPGNLHLRSLVNAEKVSAARANPSNKDNSPRAIAERIISQIHNQNPPGRFLIDDPNASSLVVATATVMGRNSTIHPTIMRKVWVVVDHEKAVAKVTHRLREREKDNQQGGREERNEIMAFENEVMHQQQNSNSEQDYGVGESSAKIDNVDVGDRDRSIIISDTNDTGMGEQKVASDTTSTPTNNTAAAAAVAAISSSAAGTGNCHSQLRDSDDVFLSFLDSMTYNKDEGGDELDCDCDSSLEEVLKQANEVKDNSAKSDLLAGDLLGLHNSDSDSRDWDWDNLSDYQEEQDDDEGVHAAEHLLEYTMHQWIEKNVKQSSPESTLQIALRLTEFILEADEEERSGEGNAVPLDSINADNVLIRGSQVMEGGRDTIDFAWIMSSLGERPAVGSVSARLFATGLILYELFSAEKPPMEDMPSSNARFLEQLDLTADKESNNNDYGRPHKKSQQQATPVGDKVSNCMAVLEGKGIPWSIRYLVKNLMECGKGECCGDDTYTSFSELKQDLSVMLADPPRFVDNIKVSGFIPMLEMCDELYGREDEMAKLDELYQHCIAGMSFKSVLISGGAGVGKSRLAMYTQLLASQRGGYFCTSKFSQNQMNAQPLATIGAVFNTLCNLFAGGATENELKLIEKELETGLGSQVGLLVGVVPNLRKLMPSYIRAETTSNCINAAFSMRYLFGELLRVISSHSSRPITLLIDDIQFADPTSLLIIGNLLFSAKNGASLFIVFCQRDDEDSQFEAYDVWLDPISIIGMEGIKLGNMNVESVNNLVSETLHITPRITRSLSGVLHQKSRGNPLFLKQLLASLWGKGHIYVTLKQPRWSWDLNKIEQEPICSSVLALLIKEMEQLHPDLQFGLGAASCLGSRVGKDVLNILSQGLGVDLLLILEQVSEKGFMNKVENGAIFCFAHDKIQQAAYELKTTEQRCNNHMKYGILLCTHTLTLSTSAENSSLFFTSINQINKGGPDAVHSPSHRSKLAVLNLKAGKQSIILSDITTAFKLFEHGISFLVEDRWTVHYKLSVDLYDAAAEAACFSEKFQAVKSYTDELVKNAHCFDDSLHCRSIAAFALRGASLHEESVKAMFEILAKLDEKALRDMEDNTLSTDIAAMNEILQTLTDEYFCNMQDNQTKRVVSILKLYAEMAHVLHYVSPSLIGAVALRMGELTMSKGISPIAPLAFAYYGETLASMGNISEGCRLGKLALKLVEKETSLKYKPRVVAVVYQLILWYTEPLQTIAETHHEGNKLGQQLGDTACAMYNLNLYNQTNYLTGQNLSTIQTNAKDFIQYQLSRKQKYLVPASVSLYYHVIALREGLHILDAGRVDDIPTIAEIETLVSNVAVHSISKVYRLVRAILFRHLQLGNDSLDIMNLSDSIGEKKIQLRPIFAIGIFYEGLMCFLRSIAANDPASKATLISKGQSILTRIRCWRGYSSWNWENKVLLLEAMEMHTLGNFDAAKSLYISSIQSARQHRFIQEEAIASELAGDLSYKQGHQIDSYALYMHSIRCYIEWDALAVAMWVQSSVESKFLSGNITDLSKTVNVDEAMKRILGEATAGPARNKRDGIAVPKL